MTSVVSQTYVGVLASRVSELIDLDRTTVAPNTGGAVGHQVFVTLQFREVMASGN